MDDCTREFIKFSILVNDYTRDTDDPSSHDEENEDEENDDVENEDEENEVEAQNVPSAEHENEENKSTKPAEASAKPLLVLKHKKPKLPTFHGDVRKYFIFREDFRHLETLSLYFVHVWDQSRLN